MELGTHRSLQLPASRALLLSRILSESGIDHPRPEVQPVEVIGKGGVLGNFQISAVEDVAFQQVFASLTRDRPDLWVEVGRHYRLLDWGMRGLAALTAPTLTDLFEISVELHTITPSLIVYDNIRDANSSPGVEMDLSGVPDAILAFAVISEIVALEIICREVTGEIDGFFRVDLAIHEPANFDIVQDLSFDIRFDTSPSRVYWSEGLSDKPLFQSNPVLHAYFVAQCREQVRALDDTLDERLARLIASRSLSLAEAADELCVSKRTLQRRLSEQKLGFKTLTDRVRKAEACRLLTEGSLLIADVASTMGYAEPTSFNHAFKRWTGTTPASFKKVQRSRRTLASESEDCAAHS